MRMKRNISMKSFNLFIALMFVLLFAITGITSAHAKIYVVTTTPDLADIAGNIGGDKVKVVSIAKGFQDPHFVEAKPSHMLKLRKADLYLVAGLDLEIGWSPVLERGARNPRIMKGASGYIDCSSGIRPVEVPSTRIDRSMGDVHPLGNPHYLTDPNNAIIVAKNIAKAFKKKDPANAGYYNKRLKAYVKKLIRAQIGWLKAMRPYKGLKVVTYHKNWSYLSKRFGLKVIGYVEPKPGIAPSPAHISKLIKAMKAHNVKILIRAPYFESKIPDMICRQTGARQVVLPLMPGAVKGADNYIDMFNIIISRLTNAARAVGAGR
ncbi:MAG: metal ABC transporter substrate-binding protein [Candidatus Eremiobacteraeota bacterium]|nr:metal ABC transporter substrate-binding protein [Candidatus Eremiobacteraeota bacterium]